MLLVTAIAFAAAFRLVVAMLKTILSPSVESTVVSILLVANFVPAPVDPVVPVILLNDVVAFEPITPIAQPDICPELDASANLP